MELNNTKVLNAKKAEVDTLAIINYPEKNGSHK